MVRKMTLQYCTLCIFILALFSYQIPDVAVRCVNRFWHIQNKVSKYFIFFINSWKLLVYIYINYVFVEIMIMERKIKLKTLNNHISCKICKGYLIDATTVTECLHTFCKSCLVKHLEENNTCPTCKIVIHQSHPLQYISFDRTMQDIVYKLVPDMQKNELESEKQFYKIRRLPNPKDIPPTSGDNNMEHELDPHAESDYHRQDEQVNVCLECISFSLKTLKRRFIRCSAQATILHLKKFVAMKVLNGMDKYKDIDILCNDELLGKDHTLKFVYVTRWRFQNPPLTLQYRPRIDI